MLSSCTSFEPFPSQSVMVCCCGSLYPDFVNSMTHPWSHNKHIVNSLKMEQTTEAGDHLQIWDDLLFFLWASLKKIDISVRWSGRFALHPGAVQTTVSAHVFLLCLSHSRIQTRTASTFSQARLLLWLLHYSQSPTGLWPSDHQPHWARSVIHTKDRERLWPWHPEAKRAEVGIRLPLRV